MTDEDNIDAEEAQTVEQDAETAPEMDPEEELEQLEEQLSQFHDTLDSIKENGRAVMQELQQEAQEADDSELAQEYMRLAMAAQTLFQRVESGDQSVRRGGL